MELRLGSTVQLADLTGIKVDGEPPTGAVRGTVTRLDGDTVEWEIAMKATV